VSEVRRCYPGIRAVAVVGIDSGFQDTWEAGMYALAENEHVEVGTELFVSAIDYDRLQSVLDAKAKECERYKRFLTEIAADPNCGARAQGHALAGTAEPEKALLSPEEQCKMFCEWMGGAPCISSECPRCHGTGLVTLYAYNGVDDADDQPCPECADDRATVAHSVAPGGDRE